MGTWSITNGELSIAMFDYRGVVLNTRMKNGENGDDLPHFAPMFDGSGYVCSGDSLNKNADYSEPTTTDGDRMG